MKAEEFFGSVVYFLVAVLVLVIGIFQYRSRKPVTFYTGEEPLPDDRYTSVEKWNHSHGIMWILYGLIIAVGGIAAIVIGSDTMLCIIPYLSSTLLPLPFMVWYHNRLGKKYIRK